jgi:hypothetical protein
MYLKLDYEISSCEEGLITNVWTKILHQCRLGIVLYYVITVKGFNILVIFHVLFYSYIFCFHRANWHSPANLTDVFRAFSSVVRQMPGYN